MTSILLPKLFEESFTWVSRMETSWPHGHDEDKVDTKWGRISCPNLLISSLILNSWMVDRYVDVPGKLLGKVYFGLI